jgi:hypothetical protein
MEARWFFADCGALRQNLKIAQRDLRGRLGQSWSTYKEDLSVTDLARHSAYHEVPEPVIAGQ